MKPSSPRGGLAVLDGDRVQKAFKRILAMVLLSLLVLSSCSPSPSPQGEQATVQRVVSGQTLEVLLTSSQSPSLQRVRLLGIVAPDLQQEPWGKAARENLEHLLGRQASVLLESEGREKDAYDRRLADVWHEGQLLNEILVRQGYALARLQSSPKYSQRLTRAQEYARIMGYGLWNPDRPLRQTPEEFRQQQLKSTRDNPYP